MTIMNDEKKKRRVLLIAFSIHMILFCSVTILLLPVVIDGEPVLFYILCGLDLLDLMVLTVKLVIDGILKEGKEIAMDGFYWILCLIWLMMAFFRFL